MAERMGKYLVKGVSQLLQSGRYSSTASLLWDEADATCEKLIHFYKEFDSPAEAEKHAVEQMAIRLAGTQDMGG